MNSVSLDAHCDILRELQVVETPCGAAIALLGEKIKVSKDMDTEIRRLPRRACTRLVRRRSHISGTNMRNSIVPLSFPALIPLWSIPLATVAGNTWILKPSERDPGTAMIIAELCKRAGAAKRSFLFTYLDSDGALE
jgi:malonate-semialdehyde dehydrogenase (acetylating)/methylmalonate-semialdehyde dehydrogenase